jgi:hypothetical protein
MKKHLFTILYLLTASLVLVGCSGEQAAPKKAAVDVKPTKSSLPQKAQSAASKAATPASDKAAGDAQKAAASDKAAGDVQKAAASNKAAADVKKPTPAAATKSAAAQKTDAKKPGADLQKDDDAQVAAKVDGEQGELPPPLTVPKGYRYQPRGRRDPFVNPIPKPVAAAAAVPVARPDGLPGVLVSELKVSGIVYSRDPAMKKAILAAGRKTYFAKQGDRLFDAVIKEIRPSEVVFTMVSTATKKPLNRETVVSTGAPNSGRR